MVVQPNPRLPSQTQHFFEVFWIWLASYTQRYYTF
jgi:hypothetical protein